MLVVGILAATLTRTESVAEFSCVVTVIVALVLASSTAVTLPDEESTLATSA